MAIDLNDEILQDFLVEKHPRDVERYFDVVETGENEIAIVYHSDRLTLVMASATRHLFVKGVYKIRVERIGGDHFAVLQEGAAVARLIEGLLGDDRPGGD